MDESNATCGKRLASIGLENTEANRQAYRQLLVTTPGLGSYISGAILFEETLYQSTLDGKKFVDCLKDQGIAPGIKVDKVNNYICSFPSFFMQLLVYPLQFAFFAIHIFLSTCHSLSQVLVDKF